MIKINYYLGRKGAKITTIFASCYIGGKKFTTSTKIKIQPKDWDNKLKQADFKQGKLANRYLLNTKINNQLLSMKSDLQNLYIDLLLKNNKVEYSEFEYQWNIRKCGNSSEDLLSFYNNIFLKLTKVGDYQMPLSSSTQEKYEITLKLFGYFFKNNLNKKANLTYQRNVVNGSIRGIHISAFYRQLGQRPSLHDINDNQLVEDFISWLRDIGYRVNTYAGHLKHIKCIVNFATDKNYLEKNNIKSIKKSQEILPPIFLTKKEVSMIENVNSLTHTESIVRDWMIILLHTGFRKGDMLDVKIFPYNHVNLEMFP